MANVVESLEKDPTTVSTTEVAKKPLINIIDLYKNYGDIEVVEKLNLRVYPGDRIALLGVNGSGKTTLMEIILGLCHQTKGQITYFPNKKKFLSKALPIFQIGVYPAKLKLKTLIQFYQDFYDRPFGLKRSRELARLLNLTPFLSKRVNNLSFGQKKKVEALVSLSVESDFYFVDEITAGVDIDARIQIPKMFLQQIKQNPKKGMIWITHNPDEIEKLCNRVVLLSKKMKGIYFDGTVDQAKKQFQSISQMLEVHFRNELDRMPFSKDE